MNNLPANIRVIKFYSKNRIMLNTLKSYFEILPHIAYEDKELNDGYVYYILPNNRTIWYVVWNIREYLNSIDLSIFSTARYDYNSDYTKVLHTYEIASNAWDYDVLPQCVKIDPNDVEKLKTFLED